MKRFWTGAALAAAFALGSLSATAQVKDAAVTGGKVRGCRC